MEQTHSPTIESCNSHDFLDIANMPTNEGYPIFTYAGFDVLALCRLASDLRLAHFICANDFDLDFVSRLRNIGSEQGHILTMLYSERNQAP